MPDLLFTPVPHTEAAAFLKQKPALAGDVFARLLPEVRARAFAVTGIESVKTLQSLRDRIADLPLGADWAAVKKDVVNEISPYLAQGEDAAQDAATAERRAELLLRTHGYQAYSAAQYGTMDAQRDLFPFWRYQTAQDDTVREAHAALDGVVLPHDDPFWQTHFPPWDFNCRCTVVPLSRADAEEIAGEDQGKPAAERSILTDDQRAAMNRDGTLNRGPATNVDVRSPRDRGRPDGYAWQPGELRLSAADLRKRYDAPTWQAFEDLARRTELDPADAAQTGRTVWDWLNGEAPAGAPLPVPVLPPEPPAPAQPRKAPVSDALTVKVPGPLGKTVRHALAVIDRAHDDGALPPISISTDMRAAPHAEAFYARNGALAKRIAISATTANPATVITHEIGHFIDHQVLDVAGQYASQTSHLLAPWRSATDASPSIRSMMDTFATARDPALRAGLEYLLRGREIWARSYTQWVATRTGDARMLAELDKMRADPQFGPLFTWPADEFAPIAEIMDALFRQKGWL